MNNIIAVEKEKSGRKDGIYSFIVEVLKVLIKKMNFDFEFSLQFQQLNIK